MMQWDEVCRRAGGRRGYNLHRSGERVFRLPKVLELWAASHGAHGWQTHAARTLGVSRRTIGRDLHAILALANRTQQCPLCGHPYRPADRLLHHEAGTLMTHPNGRTSPRHEAPDARDRAGRQQRALRGPGLS